MAATRVLYIDDDPGIRRLAERALARRGYDVVLADGGAQGLTCAATDRFGLIAVDHYMPDMDGLATLAALRARGDATPVVYVTGSEEGRIAIAALKAGAADYVVKSVGEDFFDLLAASFEAVLARAALERDKAAAQAALEASNARLAALLDEVNHRVANSLQLVSAMVRLQAGALVDDTARAALEDTQRRIEAIAQVHRRLYTASDTEQVDMPGYLRTLIDELGETLSSDAAPRYLRLTAAPLRLPPDRAVSLGVIVTELVTNACKYAYPTGGGEVRVALRAAEGAAGGAAFELMVEDDGPGLPVNAAPRGTGLGQKLIRAMAQSLQAEFGYDTAHRGARALLRAAV